MRLNIMKKKFIYLLILLVSGCVAAKTVSIQSSLSEEDINNYKNARGNNTIIGSAVLRRNDGVAVNCAGFGVVMTAVTPYTTEMTRLIYGNTNHGYVDFFQAPIITSPADPKLKEITRKEICNSQGFFTFKNVPDGDYYVITKIEWNVRGRQGGELMKRVTVTGDEEKEIVLSVQ